MAKKIWLVGIGMGNRDTLTIGAWNILKNCDCLIGAQRMLDAFPELTCRRFAATAPEKIAAFLQEHPEFQTIGVVFSGDVGFYSGAKKLRSLFPEHLIEECCGISTVAYLCAKLHTPWEDVRLVSAHGQACNLAGEVRTHEKVFVLAGKVSAQDLCKELCRAGLGGVTVSVGERLSYPEEAITTGPAERLSGRIFDPLSALLIQNPAPLSNDTLAFGLPDERFVRGNTPMTKSEVRCISLSRLRLQRESIAWDIGAGTGSVSIEMALQTARGMVYAVERDADACQLIEQNRRQFACTNLKVVHGAAPEALDGLPAPDCVFVGGSGGNIDEILRLALQRNPYVRVVINAITLETVAASMRALEALGFVDVAVSQITASRAKRAGGYHMMLGQNPVYILSGQGAGL